MKRFWLACFVAVAAVTTLVDTANAQWNQSPEIGSYQSILSRTGYGASPVGGAVGAVPGSLPGQLSQVAPPADVSYTPQASGSGSRSAGPVVSGSTSRGAVPSYGSPVTNAVPTYGAAASCGGPACGGAVTGGAVTGGGIVNYADFGQGCSNGSCGDPVYTPGSKIGNIVNNAGGKGNVNRVGGIFGVVLRRNFADPVRIGSDGTRDIFSSDIDHGDFEGLGVSLAGRRADGSGREIIYWGLDDDVRFDFAQAPGPTSFVSISQLDDLNFGGVLGTTVFQNFNDSTNLAVLRDTEINSFEANLLRNGGAYRTRRGRSGNIEILGGFRLFQFDESLRILGSGAAVEPQYNLAANNFLVGAQLGARNEVCLSQKFRLTSGINVGLFNNRAETRQQVRDQDGNFAIATFNGATHDFNFEDEQDDVAIMGEFKVGLIMQLSDRLRANVGYQALGVSGVALADDQIPLNATDEGLLLRGRTNGSLFLHGVYFGAETCF